MPFVGQSFVVIGGAGGIGFETSKQLLNEGVDVSLAFLEKNNKIFKSLNIPRILPSLAIGHL